MDSAVPIGGNIQTVSLASNRVGDVGTATVAGWGGVYLGGQPVGQLRHVTLDIVNNRVCAQRYVGSAPGGNYKLAVFTHRLYIPSFILAFLRSYK